MELISGYLLQQFQRDFDDFKMSLMKKYKGRNPSTIVDYTENHLPETLFNLRLIDTPKEKL
ncbi:hypothetical protein H1D32_22120 [Anaerobacillus sp. CMMVII]|uniref:hypothetical protein n=1 Tax=Anaerobacillus sp. CMMVII TaxID=2755588 RepID=UPI0021B727D7|nr:hypothetical protein [Anaerobacillus sp. CMMVII]MCT8140154.1 hypothetical protein [Anaerobacillus sp. CMMVII]